MTVTKNAAILNPTVICTDAIRVYDKTTANTTGPWYGYFFVTKSSGNTTWTASTPTSTKINISGASTYFKVNDQVVLNVAGGTLPAGLHDYTDMIYYVVTSTSTYLELSGTLGGGAVSYTDAGSGTFYIYPAGGYNGIRSPIINVNYVSAAKEYLLNHVVYDYGVAESDTSYSTMPIYVLPTSSQSTKPTASGIYHRLSIFVYDSTNATVINRTRSANNHLFFKDLKVTESMNRVGKASFTVHDIGDSTTEERGLLVANKNVVILAGADIIWSGQIIRAVQNKASLFDTASPYRYYTVECESDITKMAFQNVKSTSVGSYTKTAGEIVSTLVVNDGASDIDWNGDTEFGCISHEGPEIPYNIVSGSMYDQFMTLAKISGYDWRTRNNYVKYSYGVSGYDSGAKTVTVTSTAPYAADEFIGRWLLFVDSTRTDGIVSYGNITDNTTTVITMTTITNSTLPPASSQSVIIIGNPVLDFVYDLQQPDPVTTFTANKTRTSALYNCYEFNDGSDFKTVSTKVSMRGKDRYLNKNTTVEQAAITKWNSTTNWFDSATWVTYKTEGWVKSATATTSSLYLYGWDYALQVDDPVDICYYASGGSLTIESFTVTALAEELSDDGTKLTKLTLNVALTHTYPAGTFLTCRKIYVRDIENVYTVGENWFGAEKITCDKGGPDPLYGYYITTTGISDRGEGSTPIYPHQPGCLVMDAANYSEASPESDSPVDLFGIVLYTQTVDSQTTKSDLDIYAANNLISKSYYYRKASMWCPVFDWSKTDCRPVNQVTGAGWIKVGDKIVVLQNTGDDATDIEYNQYKNQWQVIEWVLDANTMRVSVTLGDFEKNQFMIMNDKTAALNYTIT